MLAIAKGPNRQLDGLPTSFSGLCHQQLMFSANQIEKFEKFSEKSYFRRRVTRVSVNLGKKI